MPCAYAHELIGDQILPVFEKYFDAALYPFWRIVSAHRFAILGRMRLPTTIEDPRVIRQILAHLGLPTEVPQPWPPAARPADLFSDIPA